MHEWTLASRVISALQDYVKSKGGGKVVLAKVKIGTLSMIDPAIMNEALQTLSKSVGMEGARFEVDRVDTKFSCRKCSRKWNFSEVEDTVKKAIPSDLLTHEDEEDHTHYPPELLYAWMSCPQCGSKDYDTIDVSGAILESVVLEK